MRSWFLLSVEKIPYYHFCQGLNRGAMRQRQMLWGLCERQRRAKWEGRNQVGIQYPEPHLKQGFRQIQLQVGMSASMCTLSLSLDMQWENLCQRERYKELVPLHLGLSVTFSQNCLTSETSLVVIMNLLNAGDSGSILWSKKTPHAGEQVSPRTMATETWGSWAQELQQKLPLRKPWAPQLNSPHSSQPEKAHTLQQRF